LCYNVIQQASSEFCQAIRRDPLSGGIVDPYVAQIRQANTGGLETSGVDFALFYGFDLGPGRLDLSSDWTWTDDFTLTPVQALPAIRNQCAGSWGGTCGEPIAEWRGNTRVTYTVEAFSVSLRHRYLSSVTNDRYILPLRSGGTPPPLANLSYPVLPSRNYLDLSFSYDVVENFQFFGGARNLLSEKPPVVGSPQIRANTYPATYDVLGTEFFLGAIARF
jgi:outer membrane receptor protein involved in Fe transport